MPRNLSSNSTYQLATVGYTWVIMMFSSDGSEVPPKSLDHGCLQVIWNFYIPTDIQVRYSLGIRVSRWAHTFQLGCFSFHVAGWLPAKLYVRTVSPRQFILKWLYTGALLRILVVLYFKGREHIIVESNQRKRATEHLNMIAATRVSHCWAIFYLTRCCGHT